MVHSLADVRSDVDALLGKYLRTRRLSAGALHDDYGFLWESLESLHKAGGKRLRPYLLVVVYEALGGQDYKQILPIGAALELLHTALLIHDDVIDRDYLRRGVNNIAGTYRQRYSDLKASEADKLHFSHSAAILAGDLMISEAYQLIFTCGISMGSKIKAAQLLGEAAFTVAGGELLDTEAVVYPLETADTLLIATLKTAHYSCVTPFLMAGLLAGAKASTLRSLEQVGTNFGIAFQLADDLAGAFADSQQTGKVTAGDLREGKRTYLLQRTLKLATLAQSKRLEAIIGKPKVSKAMVREVQEIMRSCGAKTDVERLIQDYLQNATKAINELPIKQAAKNNLKAQMNKIG